MMLPPAPSCDPDASPRLTRPLRCRVVERIFAAAVLGAWLDPTMLPGTAADPAGPASDPDTAKVP